MTRRLVDRVTRNAGVAPKTVNVFKYLGSFAIAADAKFISNLVEQPEVKSAIGQSASTRRCRSLNLLHHSVAPPNGLHLSDSEHQPPKTHAKQRPILANSFVFNDPPWHRAWYSTGPSMDREIAQDVRTRRTTKRVIVAVVAVAAVIFCVAATVSWLRPSVRRSESRLRAWSAGRSMPRCRRPARSFRRSSRSSPVRSRRACCAFSIAPATGFAPATRSSRSTPRPRTRCRQVQRRRGAEGERADAGAAQGGGGQRRRRMRRWSRRSSIATSSSSRPKQNARMHAEGLVSSQDELAAVDGEEEERHRAAQLREALARARRTTAAQIAAAQLDLRTAQREREQSQRQLDLAMARAIATACSPGCSRSRGDVRKGDVVARIADLSSYRVVATISDMHAAKLSAGMRARVKLDDATIDRRHDLVASIRASRTASRSSTSRSIERAHPRLRNNLRVDVFADPRQPRQRAARAARSARQRRASRTSSSSAATSSCAPRCAGARRRERDRTIEGLREGDEVVISNMRDYRGVKKLRLK